MHSAILACETVRDELAYALDLAGMDYELRWVESGLHNYPDKLRRRLQEDLDSLADCDRVLMAFGCCGNAVIGLETGDYELIIPRVDDCISLLIGSTEKRMEISENGSAYFLTPGWLRGGRGISEEYQHAVKRYGERGGQKIMQKMFAHYRYIGLLDTGIYNTAAVLPEVVRMAGQLGLAYKVLPASVEYVCDLLRGPWEEDRFVILPPHSVLEDFQRLCGPAKKFAEKPQDRVQDAPEEAGVAEFVQPLDGLGEFFVAKVLAL
jgi:hypothetical protein